MLLLIQAPILNQTVDFIGGATLSIFPAVESRIMEDHDTQQAFKFVTKTKKVDRYNSVMDFLFCELFLEWQRACLAYYEGEGPQLVEVLSEEQRWLYERAMLSALDEAVKLMKVKKSVCWTKFRGGLFDGF